MLVSGYTSQSTISDEDLAELAGCHSHCLRCRQAKCTHPVDNVTACAMTSCFGCGFCFHECKADEHALMCQEERVACINSLYGCPHMMKRSSIPTHLPVCPASVLCCGEEWSRWPMYTKEKGVKHPLPPSKTYIDCGQLDVGLAMRDQRMLIDSLRVPAKLKRILRNPLTQKYPAAPIAHRSPSLESSDLIASTDTSQTVSDDDTDAPWDLSRRQPGLRESISSHLVSVSQETKNALMKALNNDNGANVSSSSYSPSSPSSFSQKHASLSPPAVTANVGNDKNETEGSSTPSNNNVTQCSITQHAQASAASTSSENAKASSSPNPLSMVRSSVSSEKESEDRERSRSRSRSVSVLRDVGGSQLHKVLGIRLGDLGEGEGVREEGSGREDNNRDVICLHKMLGVGLEHDVINKYVGKPNSMYTFICAQNFRRDQYKWHFKNVHEDIHTGLNGFLEQRCPLAYAGCSFSYQRLVPSQPDSVLHFSWLQESFGLKSTVEPYCNSPSSSSSSSSSLSPSAGEQNKDLQLDSREQSPPSQAQSPFTTAHDDRNRNCSNNNNNNNNPNPIHSSSAFPTHTSTSSAAASISDLASFDRDFDEKLTVRVDNDDEDATTDTDKVGLGQGPPSSSSLSSSSSCKGKAPRGEQEASTAVKPRTRTSVRPVVFTATNPDSKVLVVYNVEEEWEQQQTQSRSRCLTDLPFEILQQIGRHLDNFSLCNLSLTSRLLRDVCCTLLDDFGLVLLNWERQKVGDKVSWKVTNKRWIFSTSFDPIKSWKFNTDHVTIADHLKGCPFNQDKLTHDAPLPSVIQPLRNHPGLEPS